MYPLCVPELKAFLNPSIGVVSPTHGPLYPDLRTIPSAIPSPSPTDALSILARALVPSSTSAKFLTAEDAAVYLGGLNSRTVTRWAREGYLPAYPIGEGKRRLWRFLEADLERWMLARRQGGQSPFDIRATEDTLTPAIGAPVGELYD